MKRPQRRGRFILRVHDREQIHVDNLQQIFVLHGVNEMSLWTSNHIHNGTWHVSTRLYTTLLKLGNS